MSSTNKTTNYQLSQFIGSDKPAWLSDYNSDMSKIDTGIEQAKDLAEGANGKADTNATNLGNLANLQTTEKTTLVGAINEVESDANTAQNSANNATTLASQANTKLADLENYLKLNQSVSIASSDITVTGATLSAVDLKVVRNSAGTLAKIYGTIDLTASNTGQLTLTVNTDTGLRPKQDIIVGPSGITYPDTTSVSYKILTNGRLEISFFVRTAGINTALLFPCLYFIEDFGD